MSLIVSPIDLGGVRLSVVSGGGLRLDGGAMFGIIPKPLWSKAMQPDEDNRIQLACNCLVIEWEGPSGRRAIVETGHGPKFREKELGIFAIDPARWLLSSLEERGVDSATITDVFLTHLHFDHAGGLTRVLDGRLVPTFPNARVHVQKREFEDARANFGIMTATYREENFTAIDEADAWNLVEGEQEIQDGVRAVLTPGHTRGHQSIVIEGRERTAIFTGDVLPTRSHVGRPYNMGYDVYPIDNRESKGRVLRLAAERDCLIVIDHEPVSPVVRARSDREWFVLDPL